MSTIEDYKAAATTAITTDDRLATERADLLDTLAKHRFFLRLTVDGLDDAAARGRTTVSGLCLGGLIKHVMFAERGWADFIADGSKAMGMSEETVAAHEESFRMLPGETLAGLLADYDEVAARTDRIVAATDLNASHPLPAAPWFEAGARWSARRVVAHIIAETAQHAGHADIIRESLDGARSMG